MALTAPATFYQNVGAVVMRFQRKLRGELCAPCLDRYFWRMTGITAVVGWLGIISLVVTPFFIINNVIEYFGARDKIARAALASGRRLPRIGMAVASFVVGALSLFAFPLVVPALAALVLAAIAIARARREPAEYGGRAFAVGGFATSAVSLCVVLLLWGGARHRDPVLGAVSAANSRLLLASQEHVLGDTAPARAMAGELNDFCRSIDQFITKYEDERSPRTAMESPCATYVEARAGTVCFLVRLPNLGRYSQSMIQTSFGLFWSQARVAAKKVYGRDDIRMAVGLYGTMLYGGLATGVVRSPKPEVLDLTAKSYPEGLRDFFSGEPMDDAAWQRAVAARFAAAATPRPVLSQPVRDVTDMERFAAEWRRAADLKAGRKEDDRLAVLGTLIGRWPESRTHEVVGALPSAEREKAAADVAKIVRGALVNNGMPSVIWCWLTLDPPAASSYLLREADLSSAPPGVRAGIVEGLLRLGADSSQRSLVAERLKLVEDSRKPGSENAHRAREVLGLVPTDAIEAHAKAWRTEHSASALERFHQAYLQHVPPGAAFDIWRIRLGTETARPSPDLYEYRSTDNVRTLQVRLEGDRIAAIDLR